MIINVILTRLWAHVESLKWNFKIFFLAIRFRGELEIFLKSISVKF